MPTLDDIVQEANRKGLMFSLYQIADEKRSWQASFHAPGDPQPAYGYGGTMESAAERALSSMEETLKIREAEKRRSIAAPASAGLFD